MASTPDDTPETPIQRALRLKKAALQARPARAGGGQRSLERTAAARATAKSKPWMAR